MRRIDNPQSFPAFQSKNNVSLIHTLMRLSCVPVIRLLSSIPLENFMNSPFLAPLARGLFLNITRSVHPCSPPLASDVLIVITLANLRLKNAHKQFYVDAMVGMVKRVPSVVLARAIFMNLLREEFDSLLNPTIFSQSKNNSDESASESSFTLTLFQSVYNALPSEVAVEALATSFLLIASGNKFDIMNCQHEAACEQYTKPHEAATSKRSCATNFRHEIFEEAVIITKKNDHTLLALVRRTFSLIGDRMNLNSFISNVTKPRVEFEQLSNLKDVSTLDIISRMILTVIATVEGRKASAKRGSAKSSVRGGKATLRTPPMLPGAGSPLRRPSLSIGDSSEFDVLEARKDVMLWISTLYLNAMVEEGREDEMGHVVSLDDSDDDDDDDEYETRSGVKGETATRNSDFSINVDYSSFLAGGGSESSPTTKLCKLEVTLRSLLLVDSSLPIIKAFYSAPISSEQHQRIVSLNALNNNVDGALLKMITSCSMASKGSHVSIPNEICLGIIELLVEKCNPKTRSTIAVGDEDSGLINDFIQLSELTVPDRVLNNQFNTNVMLRNGEKSDDEDCRENIINNEEDNEEDSIGSAELTFYDNPEEAVEKSKISEEAAAADDNSMLPMKVDYNSSEKPQVYNPNAPSLPKLANPSLFWRSCSLILCLCAANPTGIGRRAWEGNATLRALLKSATSGASHSQLIEPGGMRDGNGELGASGESAKEVEVEGDTGSEAQLGRRALKNWSQLSETEVEEEFRKQEIDITSRLFMPEEFRSKIFEIKEKRSVANKAEEAFEKQKESIKSQRRLKNEERKLKMRMAGIDAMEETLKAEVASKMKEIAEGIMLLDSALDPRHPRIPSQRAVTLTNGAIEKFRLAESLRLCTAPDYLMLILGHPTKENVSKSCEWLVPIISSKPSIISRLPPSASVYLLLTAVDDDNLVELAAPLILHTGKCLRGELGSEDSFNAAKILFDDLSSDNVKARISARKVLQESLGGHEFVAAEVNAGWLMVVGEMWRHEEKFLNLVKGFLKVGLAHEEGLLLRHYTCAIHVALTGKNLAEAQVLVRNMLSERVQASSRLLNKYPDFQVACCKALLATPTFCEDSSGKINAGKRPKKAKKIKKSGSDAEGAAAQSIKAAAVVISNSGTVADAGVSDDVEMEESRQQKTLLREGLFRCLRLGVSTLPLSYWLMMATSSDAQVSQKACQACDIEVVPLVLVSSGISKDNVVTLLDRLQESCKGAEVVKAAQYGDYWGFNEEEGPAILKGSINAYSDAYNISLDKYRFTSDGGLPEARDVIAVEQKFDGETTIGSDGDQNGEDVLELIRRLDKEAEEEHERMMMMQGGQVEACLEEKRTEDQTKQRMENTEEVKEETDDAFADMNENFITECLESKDTVKLIRRIKTIYRKVAVGRLNRVLGEPACEDDDKDANSCAKIAEALLSHVESDSEGSLFRPIFSLLSVAKAGDMKKRCLKKIFSSASSFHAIFYNLPFEETMAFVRTFDFSALHSPSVARYLLHHFDRVRLELSDGPCELSKFVCQIGIEAVKCPGEGNDLLMKLSESKTGCDLVTTSLLSLCKGGGEVGEVGELAQKMLLLQYCRFVDLVKLSNDLKITLFGAAKKFWTDFVNCEATGIDAKFAASLSDLKSEEFGAAAYSSLIDIAKNHPLIFCRKLSMIADLLEKDGTVTIEGPLQGEFSKTQGDKVVIKEGENKDAGWIGSESGSGSGSGSGNGNGNGSGGEGQTEPKPRLKRSRSTTRKGASEAGYLYASFDKRKLSGEGHTINRAIRAVEDWNRQNAEIKRNRTGTALPSSREKRVPFQIPEGWSLEENKRTETAHVDRFYYHDRSGLKLRSAIEVTSITAIMELYNISAHAAKKRYRRVRKEGIKGKDVVAHLKGQNGLEGANAGNADHSSSSAVKAAAAQDADDEGRKRKVFKDGKDKVKIRVNVRFWGDTFTDAVWAGVCSLMLVLPKEVLFLAEDGNDVVRVMDKFLALGWAKKVGYGGRHCLGFGPQVLKVLQRWRKVNADFLNSYLNGHVEGLEDGGRRWVIVRDIGWHEDVYCEGDMIVDPPDPAKIEEEKRRAKRRRRSKSNGEKRSAKSKKKQKVGEDIEMELEAEEAAETEFVEHFVEEDEELRKWNAWDSEEEELKEAALCEEEVGYKPVSRRSRGIKNVNRFEPS